jgi:para-nitrobenzyl esterase
LPVAAGGQGQEAPKPVLVFVHGGGFTIGSGNMFDGSVLASGQDIVVITINYRLDALGFFASEELAKESKHGALGSQNGALDVVTALRWVQANVHRFGGDPQQVTLGGWSAGAMMTCSLLASPVAAGLFHRAIIESGPCLGGATGWGSSPEDVVLSASAAFANGRNLSQMRAVEDGYELLQHDMTAGKIQSAPDGYLMPGHRSSWYDPSPPFAAFRNDRLNTKEIIIGATSFDGLGAFGVLGDYSTWTRMMPVAHYNRKMNTAWGSYKQGIEQIYPRSRFAGNTDAAFCKPDADSSVVCPSMEIAKAVSELGGKAYAYHFDYGPVCGELMTNEPFGLAPWGSPNWASHGAELAWVFGTKTSCFRKPAEVALTTTMQNMWGSFVRTGEPQSGDLKWDAFDDSRGNTMLFDLLPRMVDHLKTDDCAALLSVDPVLWPTVEGETILQI